MSENHRTVAERALPLPAEGEGGPLSVAAVAPVGFAAPAFGDDARLVLRAVEGDDAAERALVARVMPGMVKAVRVFARAETEDVVQESMMEVWQSAHGYRGDAPLEAWANRIAVRTAIRVVRAQRAREGRIHAEIDPETLTAPSPADAQGDSKEGTPRSVHVYLDMLSEPKREAMILRYALGHSVDEIADLTGSPYDTVRYRLVEARKELHRFVSRDVNLGLVPRLAAPRGKGPQ